MMKYVLEIPIPEDTSIDDLVQIYETYGFWYSFVRSTVIMMEVYYDETITM